MNQLTVKRLATILLSSVVLLITYIHEKNVIASETFTVTLVPIENGSCSIDPKIPADGKVPAGTVLTVTAKPSSGYTLDAVYYTVKGGMWGTTSYESFSPAMKITVNKDMSVGVVFVERSLVENIDVTDDIVYAQPGVKPLKYDVFSPKNARDLPCIILIHGGGWSSNNGDIMRGLARESRASALDCSRCRRSDRVA